MRLLHCAYSNAQRASQEESEVPGHRDRAHVEDRRSDFCKPRKAVGTPAVLAPSLTYFPWLWRINLCCWSPSLKSFAMMVRANMICHAGRTCDSESPNAKKRVPAHHSTVRWWGLWGYSSVEGSLVFTVVFLMGLLGSRTQLFHFLRPQCELPPLPVPRLEHAVSRQLAYVL